MLALFCCLLGAPALAEEPVETLSVRGWSAMDYNNHVVDVTDQVWSRFDAVLAMSLVIADEEAARAERQAYLQVVRAGIAELERVPPYRGDSTVRDAAMDRLRWLEADLDTNWEEMNVLLTKPDVSNADLERMEQLTRTQETQAAALDEALHRAQEAFARKWGAELITVEPAPSPQAPPFEHPGLVPDGSVLDAATHVGFAIRYDGRVIDSQNRAIDALNGLWEHTSRADASTWEQARVDALVPILDELVGARELPDWQGDTDYRDGLVGFVQTLADLLEGDIRTYLDLSARPFLFRKKRAELSRADQAIDADVDRALADFEQAMDRFRDRWGIYAWEAYAEEHEGQRIGG